MNAVGEDSYIRPHRHSLDPKDECLVAIKGKFALIAFDDDGNIDRIIHFGTEKYPECSAGVELPAGLWHTVVAMVPEAILLELKAGPFRSDAAKEPAPWAPAEGSVEAADYLERLRRAVISAVDKSTADIALSCE